MSDEIKKEPPIDLIFRLDTERRREIDLIKNRMEDFLRSQLEVSNDLKLVVKGQDSLRERFEIGTAGTLRELKNSFDQFRVEWGQKISDDMNRDKTIAAIGQVAEKANEKFDKFVMGVFITVFTAVLLSVLTFLIKFGGKIP